MFSRLDKEKREQFEFELDAPLEGETPQAVRTATPTQVAEENQALAAIMGMQSQIETR